MGFWETVARVNAAIATGGESEIIIAVGDSLAGDLQSGSQGGGVASSGSSAPKKPSESVFQMSGEFLLHTKSGKVWKYDPNKKKLVPVPIEEDDAWKAARSALLTTLTANYARENKLHIASRAFKNLSPAKKTKHKATVSNNLIKINKKIAELRP